MDDNKARIFRLMGKTRELHMCGKIIYNRIILQVDEVMTEGYRPSVEDILRTRIVTSGIFEINFTIGVSIHKV